MAAEVVMPDTDDTDALPPASVVNDCSVVVTVLESIVRVISTT